MPSRRLTSRGTEIRPCAVTFEFASAIFDITTGLRSAAVATQLLLAGGGCARREQGHKC